MSPLTSTLYGVFKGLPLKGKRRSSCVHTDCMERPPSSSSMRLKPTLLLFHHTRLPPAIPVRGSLWTVQSGGELRDSQRRVTMICRKSFRVARTNEHWIVPSVSSRQLSMPADQGRPGGRREPSSLRDQREDGTDEKLSFNRWESLKPSPLPGLQSSALRQLWLTADTRLCPLRYSPSVAVE